MAKRKSQKGGAMSFADIKQKADRAVAQALKTNADLRKAKTVSRTLNGLARINYNNERLDGLRPIAKTGAQVAKVLGYGEAVQSGGAAGLPQSLHTAKAKNDLINSIASNIKY